MNNERRILILLRHAKSSWKNEAIDDFDRPLAKRGKQDAQKVGFWLKRSNLIPDLILSSPAKRARKTATIVSRELALDENQIRWMPEIYDASPANLLKVLKRCPEQAKQVLLVGHNPGMEFLLEYLCRKPVPMPEDGKLLTTACVAIIEYTKNWNNLAESVAELISITRPIEMEYSRANSALARQSMSPE